MDSKKSATRLRQTCEGTLRFLSNAAQADIEVESLYEGMDLRARLSRARFEDLCEWNALNNTIDGVLSKANLTRYV
jgi:molecular chaperone DnaK (HSP70)